MKSFALLLIVLSANSIFSQELTDPSHPCTVAVADLKSGRILKSIDFKTKVGEEELTSKSFRIPDSRMIITASVFYTDESMASSAGADSMRLGLVISSRAWPDAFAHPHNAVAEITLNTFDTAQVYTNTFINGRRLLVLMECRAHEQVK